MLLNPRTASASFALFTCGIGVFNDWALIDKAWNMEMPQTPDRISLLPAPLKHKSRVQITACYSVVRRAAERRFEHGEMRALEVSFAEGNVSRSFQALGAEEAAANIELICLVFYFNWSRSQYVAQAQYLGSVWPALLIIALSRVSRHWEKLQFGSLVPERHLMPHIGVGYWN